MYKRKCTCGADKRKKKNFKQLQKCADAKGQKKLFFSSRSAEGKTTKSILIDFRFSVKRRIEKHQKTVIFRLFLKSKI